MVARRLRGSIATSIVLASVLSVPLPAAAEGQDRSQARPQNIFEAIFPGLIRERQKREQARVEQQAVTRAAPAPIEKVRGPQYYTYRADKLSSIDLAAVKLPATAAVASTTVQTAPAAQTPIPSELILDYTVTAAETAPAVVSDTDAYAMVASRFAQVSVLAEPQIAKALIAHYSANPELLWLDSQLQPNDRAKAALEVLAGAEKFGLNPADYAVELPADGAAQAEEGRLDAAARFEVTLSARAMRYALDAANGVIVPNRISGYHDFDVNHLNAAKAIDRIATGDPAAVLAGFNPDNAPFRALKGELERLDSEQDDSITLPATVMIKPGQESADLPLVLAALEKRASPQLREKFPDFFNSVPAQPAAPGQAGAASPPMEAPQAGLASPAMPRVREQTTSLEVTGGIVQTQASAEPAAAQGVRQYPTLYSPDLVDLIKAFQKETGLSADGVIGRNTAARLSGVSLASKRDRVIIAMEQLRWHPRDLGSRHVFINQPEFRARYVEGGATKLDMRVVVGRKENQTYFFHDTIETVEYNPYWGVPRSILVNEFLPKLRENPAYLDERGYEVTDGKGNRIASAAIDWWSVGSNVPFDVRQSPGEANALGELKILFPNSHAIYMHDTPARDLFNKDFRAFSHGCVRLAEPRAMAAAVLGTPVSHVDDMLQRGHGQDDVSGNIPVYVAYFTAWPNDEGKVEYFPDIYDRDAATSKALAAVRTARSAGG